VLALVAGLQMLLVFQEEAR